MKKTFQIAGSFIFSLSLLITSCKKNDSAPTPDNSAVIAQQAKTHSDDQNRFSSEIDAVADEVGLAVETSAGIAFKPTEVLGLVCNATVMVDTSINPRTITITFNGNDCLGLRNRQGVITVSMAEGTRWKHPGATLTVTAQNLRITRLADNKSITLNGSQTYTNVTGGLIPALPVLGTITHTITSNGLSITFDDNTQRTWQVAKQRIFTYNDGLVISASGTHTEGAAENIAEWGTNRFGKTFTTQTLQPLVVRQSCNLRLTSGQVKHTTEGFSATATFGLDANGNETSCPGANPYYYKVTWTGPNGNSASAILPY